MKGELDINRKLPIMISEEVYQGLHAVIGSCRIGKFLEDLARPYVVQSSLEEGYRLAATDEVQEAEALEWANGMIDEAC